MSSSTTSTDLTNGHGGGVKPGLHVIIVGAGIGGLSAAISLRQQGHDVDVYESSKFAKELGAAIHLPPNAHGLLKRMGFQPRQTGANPCEHIVSYSSSGQQLSAIPVGRMNAIWQHDWLLGHRVRLHERLMKTALDPSGPGHPVKLHLSSGIDKVDPQQATVYLKDGSTVQGDVVIGADGVHSVARQSVQVKTPVGSGKSAFRFLIPRKDVLDDPQTRKYAENDGTLAMIYGKDRRTVMYPTTDNTLLNFVCIHPESESAAMSTGDWNNSTNKELVLEVYKDFHDDFRAIIDKVETESLKVWRLLDMDVMDSWVNDRLALLGDAAHPFLPHQGQGGAVAIEDAVALGVVLERGLDRADVAARLKLYQEIRKSRADTLQQYTRMAGEDLKQGQSAAKFMLEFTNFNFGHDEFDNATQRLREWKWAQNPSTYWRMPVAFGPMPGPRQTHESIARTSTESTFTTASIKIKTSRTVLQNLFPPGQKNWRFKSPGTVAYASFSQTTLGNMEWLGGSGYNHIGLYIHGVEYVKQDGSTISGTYMPILFESLADPIVSGREELGMPKLYSGIDIERDGSSYHIRTSWQGMTWGRFELNELTEPTNASANVAGKMTGDDSDEGILVQRYIPAVGRENKGKAEADYAVFDCFADEKPVPKANRVLRSGEASFKLYPRDWKALPTLHHIIARLAEIPVYEVVDAKVVSGTGVPDVAAAHRIE